MDVSVAEWQWPVFIACVGIFTLAAACFDIRTRRIPNLLTIPMFLLGWGYQWQFHGTDGLADAGIAFALGFGTLFLLWMMGSGGGGDVKMMGALAVWLGARMTMLVLAASTVVVLVAIFVHLGIVVFRRAPAAAGKGGDSGSDEPKLDGNSGDDHRILAYAMPVALATWAIMALELPTL